MNRAKCLSFIIGMVTLALLLLDVPVSAEAALDKKVLGLINQAVFEIVVLKPTRDSLTYERPLPLDLLPYTERTDKYMGQGKGRERWCNEHQGHGPVHETHVLGIIPQPALSNQQESAFLPTPATPAGRSAKP